MSDDDRDYDPNTYDVPTPTSPYIPMVPVPEVKEPVPSVEAAPPAEVTLNRTQRVEKRRRTVMRLSALGVPVEEIAQQIGYPYRVIQRDYDIGMEAAKHKYGTAKAGRVLAGEIEQGYDEIIHNAKRIADEGRAMGTARQQLDALNLARITLKDKASVLADLGAVTREVQEIKHRIEIGLDWSAELKEKAALALLGQSLNRRLLAPVPDDFEEAEVVEVTQVEKADG